MSVKRIVADLNCEQPGEAAQFYESVFGLKLVMDLGWVVTLADEKQAPIQVTLAREGGSGTQVPRLSIEVDDLDDVLARALQQSATVVYGPVTEPWGVRRFFVEDPAGNLLNVLAHRAPAADPGGAD